MTGEDLTGPATGRTVERTVALASGALGRPLGQPVDLGGSDRSHVLRCSVGDGVADGTVIVKRFLDGRDGFLRETLGLAALDRTPDLLAADHEHGLLVMSDLGDHPTLADLLLGDDRTAAWAGARTWAHALGDLSGRSRAAVPELCRRFAASGVEPWDATADLRTGVDRLCEVAAGQGGVDRGAVEAELAAVRDLLDPGDDHAVVTPSDTCPDNAVLAPDGWQFLDLEGTDVVHAALVAVYAVLPFPTCWCVYDPPPGLTDELFAEFTQGLAAHAPQLVAEPAWSRAVAHACAVYVVLVTGWLLDGALEGRPSVGPPGRSPSYRQLVASRWRWAALHLRPVMPALSDAFRLAALWAAETWGVDAESTGYPSFSA